MILNQVPIKTLFVCPLEFGNDKLTVFKSSYEAVELVKVGTDERFIIYPFDAAWTYDCFLYPKF